MESNDSPETPDKGETSDIPSLPSGVKAGKKKKKIQRKFIREILREKHAAVISEKNIQPRNEHFLSEKKKEKRKCATEPVYKKNKNQKKNQNAARLSSVDFCSMRSVEAALSVSGMYKRAMIFFFFFF